MSRVFDSRIFLPRVFMPWVLAGSTPYPVVPHGRQGIGVVQPQAGTDFPLVRPSADIRYLLADMHLAFDQPSDYTPETAFTLPFRIRWLSGLGEGLAVPGLDDPVSTHPHDILIVDADDREVFNSMQIGVTHETRAWGNRLRVVVWRHPYAQFVSLVYHTTWNETDDPSPRIYPFAFSPESAVLDERVSVPLPRRVRSLTVVLDNIRSSVAEFHAGYNMQLAAGTPVSGNGQRRLTRVTFAAVPGAGQGVFPDCTPPALQIKTVNGVGPTPSGSFFLAATACYWIRQPLRTLTGDTPGDYPEINLTPGSLPDVGMPAETAGTSKLATGWPADDDPQYAHLQFGNDCVPCCDCPDYVEAANYLNETRDTYSVAGAQFEGVRDLYHSNRDRWQTVLACSRRKPLRLRLLPQLCPFIDVALQLCNQSGACLSDVVLTVTLESMPAGATATEVPGFTFITGANYRPGSTSPMTERYSMGGAYPEFTATFAMVPPGQSVYARFRLTYADCGMLLEMPYAVIGTLTATAGGVPITVINSENVTEPATATETQTLNCPGLDNTMDYRACLMEPPL